MSKESSQVFNVPNQITMARLALAIVVFILIGLQQFMPALICFIVAASTDWMDGYWARKYQQVTKLGRMLDPFVDKTIICGTFIFLVGEAPESGVLAWAATIVVVRELLVTALRSAIEQSGGDFSASWAGKWKMVFQCAVVILSLYALTRTGERPVWLNWALPISVWVAVLSTVYSGVDYVFAAVRMMRKP